MKISEYITKLQDLQNAVGDVEVKGTSIGNGGAVDAHPPKTEYLRKVSGREWIVRFWNTFDGEEKKGEKVVHI